MYACVKIFRFRTVSIAHGNKTLQGLFHRERNSQEYTSKQPTVQENWTHLSSDAPHSGKGLEFHL